MTHAGDEGNEEDEPPGPSESEQLADWLNCRSSRRLYVTLHEAGHDMDQLVVSVGLFVRCAAPHHEALSLVSDLSYQALIQLGAALGEETVCELIRRLVSAPAAKLRGTLPVQATTLLDRSRRAAPNARVWLDQRSQHPAD